MQLTKKTVFLTVIILAISFSTLVYYGLTRARGPPVVAAKLERVSLEVPFISKDIDLSKGISLPELDAIPAKEVELMYQVMVLPWGRGLTPSVKVKAFHNGREIYFYLSWGDETENRNIGVNEFTDAAAIMFPLGDDVPPSTIMMGFMGEANIWQWKASTDREYWLNELPKTQAYSDFYYPFEESEIFVVSKAHPMTAVHDLIAIRVGTVTEKKTYNVQGRGFWNKGAWHVVVKRSLNANDPQSDAVFNTGGKKLIAFAVWNGAKGDRGGRKSISDWVELEVKK